MSVVLLLLALPAAAITVAALRPLPDGPGGAPWLVALVGGELTIPGLIAHGVVGGLWLRLGWAGGWAGTTGILVLFLSAVGLALVQARTRLARPAIERGLTEMLGEPVAMGPLQVVRLFDPRPLPSLGVRRSPTVRYGNDPSHLIDVVAGPGGAGPRPVVLQIHGGGWTGGRLGRQGRPLLHRMAAAGWVAAEAGYRLSPRATFPDHLVDVKRAIVWLRRHAVELGADPSFIAITGGSAGGHLAALAALTANDPALQPGFADADTSVQFCVPVYGVHDLLDDRGTEPKWPYLTSAVMKSHPSEDPDLWALGSPVDRATADRPPFLIVHGGADSLVPPSDSRRLAEALRDAGGPPVGHIEIPWATHGFDTFNSVRALRHAEGVGIALDEAWAAATVGREEWQ